MKTTRFLQIIYGLMLLAIMFVFSDCARAQVVVKIQDPTGLYTALKNATTLSANQTVYFPKSIDGKTVVVVNAFSSTQTFNTGDIPFADATNPNFLTRRAIGSTGDVLTVAGGVPTWAPATAGMIDTNYVYSQPNGIGDDPHNMIQSQTDYPDLLLQQHTGTSALLMWRDITGLSEHPMIDNSGNWDLDHVTNTLAVANGGTGQVTESAAFNALAPTTTDGDMIYRNSTSNVRLGAGAAYYPLVIDHVSGRPAWQQLRLDQAVQNVLPVANGGTNTSSLNTNGILAFDGSAVGSSVLTNGQLLIGWSGNLPVAASLTAGSGITITPGSGSITIASTGGFSNPMTTLGDIIYEDATPTPARLAGNTTSTKKFLTQTGTGTISAVPAWGTLVSGDIPDLSGSYIKNQHTAQSTAGFNITDNANTVEAQIATTYTAGSATALKLVSNNTNGGHANYGLAFDVAGGATNFDLIGSSSTWSMTNAGVLALGSALTVANGGTGAATLTGILFGNGTSAITGSHAIALASEVIGTLPTANGGTGLSSPTANAVLLTNGSSALQTIAPSTSGNVLTSNGTTWASTAPTATYTIAQTIQIDNITTTSTDALLLTNTTASTSSVKAQWSPRLHLQGSAWKNATASQAVDGIIEMRAVPASTDVTPEMVFSMRSSTSAYDSLLTIQLDHSGSSPLYSIGTTTGTGRGAQIQVNAAQSTNGGDFVIKGQNGSGTNQGGGKIRFFAGRPTGNVNAQGFDFQAGYSIASGTSQGTEKSICAMSISGTAAAAPTMKLTIGSSSTVTGILNVCQSAAANASCGTGTLVAGTLTVNTTAVATGDLIFLTDVTGGTNIGTVSVGTIVNGTSFVVTSTNILDNSSFNWLIVRPN